MQVYGSLGASLRAYHDAGYFHRSPYGGNWGVEIEDGILKRVILRDLDTTLMRKNIPRPNRRRIETAYRLVDFERIISSLTGQGRAGMNFFDKKFINDIYKPIIESFLSGYFHELTIDRTRFTEQLYETSHFMFPSLGRKLVLNDQVFQLNERTPFYGRTWSNLYNLTNPAQITHAKIYKAPGGIDLNPAQMSLQVKYGGEDFKYKFNGNEVDAAQVSGATFTIRSMTSVTDLTQVLGFK